MTDAPTVPPYLWMAALATAVSIFFWARLTRRNPRLLLIYAGGIVGGLVGARITFLAAEGWLYLGGENSTDSLTRGKTVLGALLGGYLAVELVKKLVKYRQPTGDFFATIVPLGLIVARIGCLAQGCCLGKPCSEDAWMRLVDRNGIARWPAVPVEIAFNLLCLVVLHTLRKEKAFPDQHFHLYLIAYGTFRFFHEFQRDTPAVVGWMTGYQVAAILVLLLGACGFLLRRRSMLEASPVA